MKRLYNLTITLKDATVPLVGAKHTTLFLLMISFQLVGFFNQSLFGQIHDHFEQKSDEKSLRPELNLNTQKLKTKFIYSIQADQIPIGGKKVRQKAHCGLLEAKRIATKDQSINYFYIDNKRNGHFFSGDYALESHKGINTYLVAEIYDTEDEKTKNELFHGLSAGGKFINRSRMDPPTDKGTRKVVAGFVFCDFGEKINGNPDDIPRLTDQLLGRNTDGSSAFEDFFKQESNGKIEISMDVYKEDGKPTWVNLIEDESILDYTHFLDYNNVRTKVDEKINYPDHWDVVIYAFPDKATAPDTGYGANNLWLSGSQSQGKMTIDWNENSGNGQAIRHLYMNSRGYSDPILHTITIHEMLHGFGLHDLYQGTRSYGWSMMSARGPAQHILQYEKVILRWEEMETVCFLKRGIIDLELVSNITTKNQYKLLVLMQGGFRKEHYFLEVAQLIGITPEDRDEFIQENSNDFGLLLMMLNAQDYETFTPYVSKQSPLTLGGKYAGSSKGSFKSGSQFNTNGVFSQLIEAKERQRIRCIVGVDAIYHPADQSNTLRENESIVYGETHFRMSFLGSASLGPFPLVDYKNRPLELNVGYLLGYGHCAYVDNYGQFHLGKYDENMEDRKIIKSIPVPDHLSLPKGDYYLKLELFDEDVWLSVYKDNIRQYPLLREKYVECRDVKYKLASYGNVYKKVKANWDRVAWHMKGLTCDEGNLLFYSGDNVVYRYLGNQGHWEIFPWKEEASRKVSINALLELGISPKTILETSQIERSQLYGKLYQGGLIYELSEDGSSGKVCYPEQGPKMNWDASKKHCEDLGDGWYFPSKEEVKIMRANLPIGILAPWYYWSSTIDANNGSNAWVTSPNSNIAQWPSPKTDEIYARAVRTFKTN